MKEIEFYSELSIDKRYFPQPASKFLPDWYKQTSSFWGEKKSDGNGSTMGTIKKCMPVFDAITMGYIITLPADIYVTQRDNNPYYEWANHSLLDFHPVEQAPTHPISNGFRYPKFMNPWAIRTAVGYSSLFVQPFHREALFTIMPGVVDTDTYNVPVNFPFTLNNPKYEGLIPAGTPIVQVIPIKREQWQLSNRFVDMDETKKKLYTKIFDRYKSQFWHRKEYK